MNLGDVPMAGDDSGRARLERTWAPLIGFGVLLGFGVQPAMPFINPTLVMIFVMCAGGFYYMSVEHLYGTTKPTTRREYVGLALALGALLTLTLGVMQFALTMNEIAVPCQRLRQLLLVKADSSASDAYSALHCPAIVPLLWPWDYPW
jgi:hypothetical protein